ncbi:MAG: hypothetical protein H5T61_04800 [Thermoflexales bacterium]|nr:hypothetical protein [Thermoflexales bacterium]
MNAYVYTLEGTPEALRPWAERLGQPLYHWVADAARLTMGAGLPDDWKDQGAAFGPEGELRWWREGEAYRALLLTDGPVGGLEPVPGDWTADEETFFLQSLKDRRLKPNFAQYPHGAKGGQFRARVYFCNGVAAFVSPRVFLKGGDDAKR